MRTAICHPYKKHYALGMCRSCYEKDLRQRNPEFTEKQRKNCKEWYNRGKTGISEPIRYDNPEQRKQARVLRRYDLSLEDYDTILKFQGGTCALCPATEPKREDRNFLYVEHCHRTGYVRGLVCDPCNNCLAQADALGVGWFLQAAEYLSRDINTIRNLLGRKENE